MKHKTQETVEDELLKAALRREKMIAKAEKEVDQQRHRVSAKKEAFKDSKVHLQRLETDLSLLQKKSAEEFITDTKSTRYVVSNWIVYGFAGALLITAIMVSMMGVRHAGIALGMVAIIIATFKEFPHLVSHSGITENIRSFPDIMIGFAGALAISWSMTLPAFITGLLFSFGENGRILERFGNTTAILSTVGMLLFFGYIVAIVVYKATVDTQEKKAEMRQKALKHLRNESPVEG